MKNKYYYIFGLDAIIVYNNNPKEDFIETMKRDDSIGILYEYDDSCMFPNKLLNDFSGWGDYIEITEKEYNYFKKEIYK